MKVLYKSILIFSLYLIINTDSSSNPNCEFTTEDGTKYDFEKLRKTDKDYEFNQGRYTYKANFCGPLISKCSNGPNVPAAYFLTANSVCLSKLAFSWNPTISYIDSIIKTLGVKLTLPSGEKCYVGKGFHTVVYNMKCDLNEELKFISADKINTCSVEYHFTSKYACQMAGFRFSFSFISDGSLFTPKNILITFSSILFFYFVLFTYFNYKRNPEDGLIKSFPHREFWSNFMSSISEGCNTTYRYLKEKISGRSHENEQLV